MKIEWTLTSLTVFLFFTEAAIAQSAYSGEIVNDRFMIKSWETGSYVVTIGEIQNNSNATLDDLIVEARFFDSDGELIDAAVERLYSISVPPAERVAFRLQSLAIAEDRDYASHQVRLVSASESWPCAQSASVDSGSNLELIKRLTISSFPILLLIAVWIYFMRRAAGKNSPQSRTLELIDQQNEMLQKQSQAVERIADALDDDRGSRSS